MGNKGSGKRPVGQDIGNKRGTLSKTTNEPKAEEVTATISSEQDVKQQSSILSSSGLGQQSSGGDYEEMTKEIVKQGKETSHETGVQSYLWEDFKSQMLEMYGNAVSKLCGKCSFAIAMLPKDIIDAFHKTCKSQEYTNVLNGFISEYHQSDHKISLSDVIKLTCPIETGHDSFEVKGPLNINSQCFYDGTRYDDRNTIGSFIQILDGIALNFARSEYLAPVTAIVQHSMSGKSSLLYEAGKRRWSFYVNVRQINSSGFPCRTPVIADELVATGTSAYVFHKFCAFYLACVKTLTSFLNDLYRFFQTQLGEPEVESSAQEVAEKLGFVASATDAEEKLRGIVDACKHVWIAAQTLPADSASRRLHALIGDEIGFEPLANFLRQYFNEPANFWIRVAETMSSILNGFLVDGGQQTLVQSSTAGHDFVTPTKNLLKILRLKHRDISNVVYVHFDDARSFIQPIETSLSPKVEKRSKQSETKTVLQCCRSAAALFMGQRGQNQDKLGFAVTFTDTSSKVANFVPQDDRLPDSSFRFSMGDKLYDPIWTIRTFDAAFLSGKADFTVTIENLLKQIHREREKGLEEELIQVICKYGSPCWNKMLECGVSIEDVYDIASKKITNCVKEPNETVAAALIASRFHIQKILCKELNDELAASHMATLLYVNNTRTRCNTAYPSEPMLAEGAINIMSASEFSVEKLLPQIRELQVKELVTPGPRGEFVSRVVSLLAVEEAAKHIKYPNGSPICNLKPITVHSFLHALYGQSLDCDCLNWQQQEAKTTEKCRVIGSLSGQMSFETIKHLLDAFIFCNHAFPIDYDLVAETFKPSLLRGMMIQCCEGQEGINQAIPIFFTTGPHKDQYSFIGIQSRNYEKGDPEYSMARYDTSAAEIGLTNWKLPYLILYYSFGYVDVKISNLKYRTAENGKPWSADINSNYLSHAQLPLVENCSVDDNMAIVGIFGLNSFTIVSEKTGILDPLQNILKTEFSEFKLAENDGLNQRFGFLSDILRPVE